MTTRLIECHGDDRGELDSFLSERIYEFNAAALGCDDGRLFGFAMRDQRDQTVAGVSGHTWAGICYISNLWVSDVLRGEGIGRQLVQRVEVEAVRRGCRIVLLSTHSFQSPRFYQRLGYVCRATIADHPVGHANHVFAKRLAEAPACRTPPAA